MPAAELAYRRSDSVRPSKRDELVFREWWLSQLPCERCRRAKEKRKTHSDARVGNGLLGQLPDRCFRELKDVESARWEARVGKESAKEVMRVWEERGACRAVIR